MESQSVFSILQITDTHLLEEPGASLQGVDTEACFRAVIEDAKGANPSPDCILLTGDLSQDGSDSILPEVVAMR